MPPLASEEDLREFFEDCGTILELALPRKKGTDEIKGFAIVVFGTEAAVVNALKLDKDPLKGQVRQTPRQHPHDGHALSQAGVRGLLEPRTISPLASPPVCLPILVSQEIRVRRSKPKNKGDGGGQNPSFQTRMEEEIGGGSTKPAAKAPPPQHEPGHYSRGPTPAPSSAPVVQAPRPAPPRGASREGDDRGRRDEDDGGSRRRRRSRSEDERGGDSRRRRRSRSHSRDRRRRSSRDRYEDDDRSRRRQRSGSRGRRDRSRSRDRDRDRRRDRKRSRS